jgi:hypothetical protein
MSTFYHLFLPNRILKLWAIPETTQTIEYLWNPVISKYGDLVYIVELSEAFAFECCPQVRNTNLSSLEKADILPIFKTHNVVETRKVIG